MKLKFAPALMLAASCALAQPAMAAESKSEVSPGVAAGLSALTPFASIAVMQLAFPPGVFLSPLFLGSGQLYAGDPMRGLLVGAGGYAAILGGGTVLGNVMDVVSGRPSFGGWQAFSILLATVGYTGWASVDAYQTAERKNLEARKTAGLQGGAPNF